MTQSGCSDKPVPAQAEPTSLSLMSEPSQIKSEATRPYQTVTQTSASGLSVSWIPFGAHLISVRLPDGTEILAAHNQAEDYQGGQPYLGGMIGRVANRIEEARFTIDDTTFTVPANEGRHTLHSGPKGFDRVLWDITKDEDVVILRYTSQNGDQSYPGNLDVTIRSHLSDRELTLQIIAITDAPTPVNLTHHGYWNPSGQFDQPINGLILSSPADRYLPVTDTLIPTGEIFPTDATPYDFRQARPIGPSEIDATLLIPDNGLRDMARLSDGVRSVTVLSDYPSLQIYSGDSLGSVPGLSPRAGLALEPQYPPNAVNRPIDGEDTILQPGEVYRHTIVYRFDGPGFDPETETR